MAWVDCLTCGSRIASNATACPYCGARREWVQPPAAGHTWGRIVAWTVAAAGLILAVGIGASIAIGNRSRQPALQVTAADLIAAYEANTVRADQTYKNRETEISGTVADIGTEILGKPYLMLHDRFGGVQAVFPRERADRIARVAKGQTVRVRCTVSGRLVNVIATDCTLVD